MIGERRRFGRTGFAVTPLALGTSSWGAPRDGESDLDRDRRVGEVGDAFFAGRLATNLVDTSNIYGPAPEGPLAELLLGAAAARAGSGAASGLVLQTKLDRDLATDDFGADRMWRSLEESLTRLGVERVDVLYLHDPEVVGFESVMTPGGAVEALVEMKRQGVTASIGISGGPVDMLQRFVETDLFDALITHNRFTLLDRSADELLDAAAARDVGVANAAPYGGGVLTGRPEFAGSYGYRPITEAQSAELRRLAAVAERFGVPISALALGFSLREPRIHTTVVGASSLSSWNRATTDALAAATAPAALWDELLP
ncbi:aldo/keto reductase [Herbiconiux moechotypicola]|uniref:NADP-dependent oxidoreductase domain-containing protein n=1 Tax=Herbiconiux moechotypicola TaxID=637393 RepID=A0ABN3D8P0_9MICO|nr:aldo/keto reductase [Herbiconiux moechotypicola]MCS5728208.1 aldo/keto reductase [Herbiconiux moechotypicola]